MGERKLCMCGCGCVRPQGMFFIPKHERRKDKISRGLSKTATKTTKSRNRKLGGVKESFEY